jgi:hypothetical protein
MKLSLTHCLLPLFQHLGLDGGMALFICRNANSGTASPQILLSFIQSHFIFSANLKKILTQFLIKKLARAGRFSKINTLIPECLIGSHIVFTRRGET